jgi:NTP pyrophosphatase (non-canonical NTP hydrolase)
MVRVVGLGSGAADAVPAAALAALAAAPRVVAPPLSAELLAVLPAVPGGLGELSDLPADATVAAPDAEAHRLACALPRADTLPGRDALRARAIGAEVAALAEVGLRLRRECPWDREQTAETIVPHTIEEAFEVADAVAAGDAGLPDELGDLLFQTVFLSQLLEEQGTADLAQGIFHELPAGLPALAYATKAQRRAAAVGFDFPGVDAALAKLEEETAELREEQQLRWYEAARSSGSPA